jgi:hypothetical protein
MSRIQWNSLGKIWIQNVGDTDFLSDFSRWKFKYIPKNQVLEGKISWGRGNTWANDTGHTSISYTAMDEIVQ